MARADLLINLAKAGSKGDQTLFKRTLETLIAEERRKNHNVLADRLEEHLKLNGQNQASFSSKNEKEGGSYVYEITPRFGLDSLFLNNYTEKICQDIIEEQQRSDLLRAYNIEPRSKILLKGPPGNGKTSLAEAISYSLFLPLFVVRYEALIGSYLGETTNRLAKLFDFVRSRPCVLFFDEFDVVGKERGDTHETGEIKRVVSSLLLQIDSLPSYVVAIAASNHSDLLDKAVWRRFQATLNLPKPGEPEIKLWIKYLKSFLNEKVTYPDNQLLKQLNGLSYSELEDFKSNVVRKKILSGPDSEINKIISQKLKEIPKNQL